MKKNDVLDLVCADLRSALSETDFRFSRKHEGFVRRIPGGDQGIGIPVWRRYLSFELSLVVTIRIDAAERIVGLFSGAPPGHEDEGFTTALRLESFTSGPTLFKVRSDLDIHDACAELLPILRKEIVPFLDSHTDVFALDQVMNGGDHTPTIPMQPYRAMDAAILAKLADNPRFDSLLQEFLHELRNAHENDREKFTRLAEYLRTEVQPLTGA